MTDRKLPSRKNPLLGPVTDNHYRRELIARRKLGQTELAVDAGQVGTSNATKPKNLGNFDYAHIRVPLPKDLKGSGIFHASRGHSTPEAYFLMRRSSDGFVSASGMYKVAFPWSSDAEEHAEKAHLKKLPGVGKEEIAGNIWVPPQQALDLSDEYDMRDWILILLDPTHILAGHADLDKDIKSPPVFHADASPPPPLARSTRAKTPTLSNGTTLAPPESPKQKSPRKRALRSMSPTKIPAPDKDTKTPRKMATPKRTQRGRPATGSASVEPEAEEAAPAKSTRKVSKRTKKEDLDPEDTVKVNIRSTTETSPTSDAEIETTHVEVETPASHPNMALPDDAQAYLDSAKKAIREAKGLKEAHQGSVRGRKRKAADLSRDEADEAEEKAEASGSLRTEDELPASKRIKMQEIEIRKDQVKKRAAVGIAAGLALGAMVPFFVGTFLGS